MAPPQAGTSQAQPEQAHQLRPAEAEETAAGSPPQEPSQPPSQEPPASAGERSWESLLAQASAYKPCGFLRPEMNREEEIALFKALDNQPDARARLVASELEFTTLVHGLQECLDDETAALAERALAGTAIDEDVRGLRGRQEQLHRFIGEHIGCMSISAHLELWRVASRICEIQRCLTTEQLESTLPKQLAALEACWAGRDWRSSLPRDRTERALLYATIQMRSAGRFQREVVIKAYERVVEIQESLPPDLQFPMQTQARSEPAEQPSPQRPGPSRTDIGELVRARLLYSATLDIVADAKAIDGNVRQAKLELALRRRAYFTAAEKAFRPEAIEREILSVRDTETLVALLKTEVREMSRQAWLRFVPHLVTRVLEAFLARYLLLTGPEAEEDLKSPEQKERELIELFSSGGGKGRAARSANASGGPRSRGSGRGRSGRAKDDGKPLQSSRGARPGREPKPLRASAADVKAPPRGKDIRSSRLDSDGEVKASDGWQASRPPPPPWSRFVWAGPGGEGEVMHLEEVSPACLSRARNLVNWDRTLPGGNDSYEMSLRECQALVLWATGVSLPDQQSLPHRLFECFNIVCAPATGDFAGPPDDPVWQLKFIDTDPAVPKVNGKAPTMHFKVKRKDVQALRTWLRDIGFPRENLIVPV